MKFALFYHSVVSDWNHGNAHFLRGIATELMQRGHHVNIFEPEDSWSRANLLQDAGLSAIEQFRTVFPNLDSQRYSLEDLDFDRVLDGVSVAIVHEWSDPELVRRFGLERRRRSNLRLWFHDTHHRVITAPQEMARFDLGDYDGLLVYGASLKEAYHALGWRKNVHVWHEAADTNVFYPHPKGEVDGDLVWVGNWGDDERTQELQDYLFDPVRKLGLKAAIYGVRYPAEALEKLSSNGISYGGWIANFRVPAMFARFRATVHVPRRPYVDQLSGIPTIRPFEAMACGIPLISAPWNDSEGLFRVGTDFLMAQDHRQMASLLRDVLHDVDLSASLVAHGLETIRSRHTCAHRVDELLQWIEEKES